MKCSACSHDNREGARFCDNCGGALSRQCPSCGMQLRSEAKFCDHCGASIDSEIIPIEQTTLEEQFDVMQKYLPSSVREKLSVAADGENRIVTVLLADMTSSVETTKDLPPEEAAELVSKLLKTMIDVLSKYECRIDNIVGDEVVAVFGVPQTHENDPERAILAALEVKQEVQKIGLNVSVGINTGEVYFGGLGSDEHQKHTVYGNVVNMAARLQGAAGAGEIIVGEATYRHARRSFEFTECSLENVKGVEGPVVAFRVERVLTVWRRYEGSKGCGQISSEGMRNSSNSRMPYRR